MNYDVLYNWISPITGRITCDRDYVLVGDNKDIATPSPALIDLKLDLVNLRDHYNILNKASFVIGFPNSELPDAQVLNTLPNGYMYNTAGIVSTITNIPYAPDDATFILQTPNAALPNAQGLSDLTGGILKSAAITGVVSIASGGQSLISDDYVRPIDLFEQIQETRLFATAEAAAAEAAAIASSIAYFTYQMLPFVPSPLPLLGVGSQITAAIGVVAATAAAAHTRINNLSLAGDILGVNGIGDVIVTVFKPNPIFTGNESLTMPSGNTDQRPSNLTPGMIRFNSSL